MKRTSLEKLGARGGLLWFRIVTFAFVVVAIMAVLMTQEWSIAQDAAASSRGSTGDAAKNDKESLQGTWIAISLEADGKKMPGTVVTHEPSTGVRPTRFATDAKTGGLRLMTLKRQQPDIERIQGTWAAVSAEYNGREVPEPEVQRIGMTFQGDKVKVKGFKDRRRTEEGTFRLGPMQKPKWIDLRGLKKRVSGIYILEADRLIICFNQNDAGERPKTFATDRETELSLIVLKRQKP